MRKPIVVGIITLLNAAFAIWINAQAPFITVEGRLVQGTNLVDRQVAMKLRVFTNDIGGNLFYEKANMVDVADGYYSFPLGVNPNFGQFKKAVRAANVNNEIEVNGMILSPRAPCTPPPSSRQAEDVWRSFGFSRDLLSEVMNSWPKRLRQIGYSCDLVEPNWQVSYHNFALFPPPIESREIIEAKVVRTGIERLGTASNRPTLTILVVPFQGAAKRAISEPLDVKSLVRNSWSNFTLVGNSEDRTISPNEMAIIHFWSNTNSLPAGLNYEAQEVMFQIRVQ